MGWVGRPYGEDGEGVVGEAAMKISGEGWVAGRGREVLTNFVVVVH